jgi:hypothetical protein
VFIVYKSSDIVLYLHLCLWSLLHRLPAPSSYCLRCLCASTALGCSGGAPPSTGLGCAGGLCANWGACTKLLLPQVSVRKHGAWVQRGSAPFYGVGVCGWPVCKLGCLHQALTASGVCAQARGLRAAGERPLLGGWGVWVACVQIGVPAPSSYCLRCLCASTALGCSGGAPPSRGLGCVGGLCANWGACTKLLLPQVSVRKHGAWVQRGSALF